jgi:hypothetical protein
MDIIFIEDIETAQRYADDIHEYLNLHRPDYNAVSWQTFEGEPPYFLEVPDDIPQDVILDALE